MWPVLLDALVTSHTAELSSAPLTTGSMVYFVSMVVAILAVTASSAALGKPRWENIGIVYTFVVITTISLWLVWLSVWMVSFVLFLPALVRL